MNPLVSVIVPTYNAEKYLPNLFEMIIAQTYNEWELILVDDGSTDNSIDILKSGYELDDRISVYYRSENQAKGADTCRNIGQEHAKGKYFIVIDCDDIVEKYCLEQRVNYMETHSDLDFAIFPGRTLIQQGECLVEGEKLWGVKGQIEPLNALLRADYCFGVWNVIFKSESMINNLWDERLKVYMDFDYMLNMLLGGYKYEFSNTSKYDYGYVQGRNNAITSSFVSSEKHESTMYLLKKTSDIICKAKRNELVKHLYYFYLMHYQKICYSNDLSIYREYYEFFIASFPQYGNFRLKLLNLYVMRKFKHNNKVDKKLHYYINILFYIQRTIRGLGRKKKV